ncbi:MAG: hypothetical protein HY400_05810 [Elusimicrobia bacterium]|nr:hypothetical protein [Elusimicrobiota bacterium]
MISSSLLMVVAQRLVRTICKQCREPYEVDSKLLIKLGLSEESLTRLAKGGKIHLARGKGCDNCAKTGYRGRIAVHEVLELTDTIRELVNTRAPSGKIKEAARKNGMMTLRESAISKVLAGVTTIEEMIRVTASDVD